MPKEKPPFPVQSLVLVERRPSALHRSRIDIIANILRASDGGARKTHIMYKCNLSFRQLHVYIDFLVDRGLLRAVSAKRAGRNDSKIYVTTTRGKAFIRAYNNIRALLAK